MLAVAATGSQVATAAAADGCPTNVPMWSADRNSWNSDGRGPDAGPYEWFTAPSIADPIDGNPLADVPWFVDCQWDEAWKGARLVEDWDAKRNAYVTSGAQSAATSAAISSYIARQPIAKWIGPSAKRDDDGKAMDPNSYASMYVTVHDYMRRTAAQAPGAMRFVILRRLEQGNCRKYTMQPPNGPYGRNTHRQLVNAFADGVRDAADDGYGGPVTIVIEPDIMPSIKCTIDSLPARLKRPFLDQRIAEIRYAISKLGPLPDANVYVDGGASDYVGASYLADSLYKVLKGNSPIRGFSLNVTHYDWAGNNFAYGEAVAASLTRRLGRTVHFVISTGRSGGGKLPASLLRKGFERGCNIPNAGLGPAPTLSTPYSRRYLDGFLWLLNPGFSDGNCQSGRNYRTGYVHWTQTLAVRLIRQRCQGLIQKCLGPRRPDYYR